MSPSPHTVLTATVSRAEQTGRPVRVDELAQSLDVSEDALNDPLESLCEYELLQRSERGYRPTVTAHELLALDVELDDFLVLDIVDG